MLAQQQRGDEVAADDEEHLDAEEAAAEPVVVGVVHHHCHHCERAKAVQADLGELVPVGRDRADPGLHVREDHRFIRGVGVIVVVSMPMVVASAQAMEASTNRVSPPMIPRKIWMPKPMLSLIRCISRVSQIPTDRVVEVGTHTELLAKDGAAVGVGMGQVNRVDSCRLAVTRAGEDRARGSVAASDAFFPFRDGLDAAVEAGATAVIQPGGSVRDDEVIKAADDHNVAMVFTGTRHFRH